MSPADPLAPMRQLLAAEALAFVDAALAERARDPGRLPVLFPQLPRRAGKTRLGGGLQQIGPARVDLDAFRACDAGACLLLAGATPAERSGLYAHGDLEERTMLLRAMALLPPGPDTVELLGEVQRTNMVVHVEAALCDSDLLARAVGLPGFGVTECNRMVLKLAFLDLPLQRVLGAERHANPELSRMLQDLATEREAAGRAVWRDTWRLIGRAPTAGSVARLVGGLEHGDDGVRAAAADGLAALGRRDLLPWVRERLEREPRPAIRAALQRLLEP